MIEREIELIKSRSDSSATFIDSLLELKSKKERLMSKNKDLSRLNKLFLDTPINKNKKF